MSLPKHGDPPLRAETLEERLDAIDSVVDIYDGTHVPTVARWAHGVREFVVSLL